MQAQSQLDSAWQAPSSQPRARGHTSAMDIAITRSHKHTNTRVIAQPSRHTIARACAIMQTPQPHNRTIP
eukprot:11163800-Lingulodinium_polyedra.AAC.2